MPVQNKPIIHARDHLEDGADPIRGLVASPSGEGLEDIILAKNPVGFWKLNESSGTTAYDSSGNNNDMTVPGGGYLPPTWAQAAGPPGDQSARWTQEPIVSDAGTRLSVALPAPLLNNFSAGVWMYFPTTSGFNSELIGQGVWGSTNSWSLWFFDGSPNNLLAGYIGTTAIYGNNHLNAATWYLVGLTRDSGTTTLYVDGLAQASTTSTSPGIGNANAWLGNCGGSTSLVHGSDATMSWAFITDTPLSGDDWVNIQAADPGGGPLAEGLVPTSDGVGGYLWAAPTVEVNY